MTFNSGLLRGMSVLCVQSFLKTLERVDIVARKFVVRIKMLGNIIFVFYQCEGEAVLRYIF